MKISIIGHGFVGKALEKCIKDNIEIKIIDPVYNTDISQLKSFQPEIIFVCVPTPMNKDGSQDISIVEDVIDNLIKNKVEALIILKSTVLPSSIEILQGKISRFIYNPEFLREKHAFDDFINAETIFK